MSEKLYDLKSLVEFASANVEKIFRRTRVLLPMYHAITTDGETMILQPPPGNKDISVAMVKAWMQIQRVDRYVFMDEAWMVDDSRGQFGLDVAKMQREGGASNHPERREIVMFSAENRRGEMLTAKRFILRPEVGKPTLSRLEIDDMTGVTSEGRMVGLLQWEKLK
jgi:hypothetical protein